MSQKLQSALNLDTAGEWDIETHVGSEERSPDISHMLVSSEGTSQITASVSVAAPTSNIQNQANQPRHKHPTWLSIHSSRSPDFQHSLASGDNAAISPASSTTSYDLEIHPCINQPSFVHTHENRAPPPPVVSRIPPELLLQIFDHFDPNHNDTTAHLSSTSTTASLRACALVCKRWNMAATRVLWRKPRVYDVTRFGKLVDIVEGQWKGKKAGDEAELPENDESASNSSSKVMKVTYPYATYLSHLSLSPTLPETSRHSTELSTHLSRLLSVSTLNLTSLDISFCKGISNYTLQKCAQALRHLQYVNLAGGGRSEICVIRIATQCGSRLKGLGLGWNDNVGDFCVKEVGRLCTQLEWVDLSGCWRVGDVGVAGLARGCGASLMIRNDSGIDGVGSDDTGGSSSSALLPVGVSGACQKRSTLRHVNLSYCTSVTDIGVQELLDRCGESLEVLNVVGCGDVGLGRYVVDSNANAGTGSNSATPAGTAGDKYGWRRVVVNLPGFVPYCRAT